MRFEIESLPALTHITKNYYIKGFPNLSSVSLCLYFLGFVKDFNEPLEIELETYLINEDLSACKSQGIKQVLLDYGSQVTDLKSTTDRERFESTSKLINHIKSNLIALAYVDCKLVCIIGVECDDKNRAMRWKVVDPYGNSLRESGEGYEIYWIKNEVFLDKISGNTSSVWGQLVSYF
jgi:hypothetical protein